MIARAGNNLMRRWRLAAGVRLSRSADGRFFAQVPVENRDEIYGLKSASFRDWLIAPFPRRPPQASVHSCRRARPGGA